MVDEAQTEELTPEPSPRPLRVAWIASRGTLERFGRVYQPLAIGLMDEMVSITALHPAGADLRQLPTPAVATVAYRMGKWWTSWRRVADDLLAGLRNKRFDLIHALEASSAELAQRLAAALDVPYVVSSYSLGDGGRLRRFHRAPKAVFAASTAILKDLRRYRFLPADSIHLLRPGVYQVRQATCFIEPQYSVTIVAGGKMDDLAANSAVVKAFSELRSRNYDCVFFILGSGRAERQVRRLSERLAMRQTLTFSDAQPLWELPGIFKSADIYISPVPSRTLDIECLLAMAAGVPVLASSEGAADFIRSGQTSLMFARGDASDLAEKLTGLLEDRPSAKKLAESALAYLRENHGAAGMVAEVSRTYRSLLAPKA